jgi:glycosyl transferase family 25
VRTNELVDAVYVLSVKSFTDRIAHIRAELARHGIDFEFVFDYDANAIPAELAARVFAPSEMKPAHQSLVLKHMRTWKLALERDHRRVLVFEDDAMLADGFDHVLTEALAEAERLPPGWLVYLGRGNNQHVGSRSGPALLPGGSLPATDALVFDREAARRRLAYLDAHKVVRPADWLTRETDAAVGIAHWWLREPTVEQGSMNGRFGSVLDAKRRFRGRWYAWLRFRWDAWNKRVRRDLGLRSGR